MSGVARSQSLIAHVSTSAGFSSGFVCPDGHVTLVKSAQWWSTNPATVNSYLFVGPTSGGTLVLSNHELAANTEEAWEGWVALNPGDYVAVYAADADVHILVSGAVLAGPPQFPRVSVGTLPAGEPHG